MIPGPAVAASPRGANNTEPSNLRGLQDHQLLARFFRGKEDAAFAAIVERYGPLVFGVCRRILSDPNDADDAFQATFLVLVRKGASLRDPGKLANWLYGVAYRTASKLRAKAALRTKSERQAGEMPTKSDFHELNYDDLQAILDEEISQLPEKYALPLVLCYLEGKTNAQAAAQLGWPEGSISRRLSRARELLRSRLARRGLALSVALIAAVFARPATASVSTELLSATTRAAVLAAQGVELDEIVSPTTAKLVHDVLAGMSAAGKFTIPTIAVVASLLIVITTAIWQFGSPVQAANFLPFGRASAVHGLTTTPVSSSVLATPVSAAAAEGASGSSCGAAAPPVASAASGAVAH
jgi:RNA polymerase sigma factor (sigma-70 family)